MKQLFTTLIIAIVALQYLTAQSVSGTLTQHAGQVITLTGFDYYQTYELAKGTIDTAGNFTLAYPKNYQGMAVLNTQDKSSLVLALTESDIHLDGTHIRQAERIQFKKGSQNHQFTNLVNGYSQRNQAYKAWRYLQGKYKSQEPLSQQVEVLKNIEQELHRIEKRDEEAINTLPANSYLNWFVSKRKLVNDMPQSVHNYIERISQNILQFRTINFTNTNFKTSGLFQQLIEGHYMLLENMGQPLDTVYKEMNTSTNYLINNLRANNSLLNTVSGKLFKYFEKRSLISVAAHLANKLLSEKQFILNDSLANSMQKYVALKVGNLAPDIQLSKGKLSDINKPVLLVFGASWCPHCATEKIALLKEYNKWQKNKTNIEVVYVSLDTDKQAYDAAFKNTPWQNYYDFKGWDTEAAKDYFINGTPTYVLLDKDLKILVHPNSILHVNAWVTQNL